MKIAVAIAPENDLPSAFVIFRGLENNMEIPVVSTGQVFAGSKL